MWRNRTAPGAFRALEQVWDSGQAQGSSNTDHEVVGTIGPDVQKQIGPNGLGLYDT